MGAPKEQGRIKLAQLTIADLLNQGKFVVPVFSAFRRGRSGSPKKVSVTDILMHHQAFVAQQPSFREGMKVIRQRLVDTHYTLIKDLKLEQNEALRKEIDKDINNLCNLIMFSCRAYEAVPSTNDVITTGGERLAVKVISAYLNRKHAKGEFPMRTAPVTALELGLYTDNQFGSASIDWARAVDHSREVIVGQYLQRNLLPVVTGFDGIYDPNNEFKDLMATDYEPEQTMEEGYTGVYRTSLGRGGSDLTATFLGMALNAEYVGFCKDTPGVLTGDDMLVGPAAETVAELDYELATEAGNIYSRAVEPVRHTNVPIHIFDPARPSKRTIVSNVQLPAGLYIIERPLEAVNIQSTGISGEPGALLDFLQHFAIRNISVEEIRHQRSGTDCIVCGDPDSIHQLVDELNQLGFHSQAHFTWYIRVVGNITEELSATFNEFMLDFEPLTLSTYQIGTKVVTATVARNRAGGRLGEAARIGGITQRIHDELLSPVVMHRSREMAAVPDTSVPAK